MLWIFKKKIARCRSQETQGNLSISKLLGIYSPSWIVRRCDRRTFALRVIITKSEEQLQTQLFRLSEMRNDLVYNEKMREDQAWQRKAQTLRRIHSQLCGQNMKIHQDDKLSRLAFKS